MGPRPGPGLPAAGQVFQIALAVVGLGSVGRPPWIKGSAAGRMNWLAQVSCSRRRPRPGPRGRWRAWLPRSRPRARRRCCGRGGRRSGSGCLPLVRTGCAPRVHSVADLPAAARCGLLRAVRLLVVPARWVRSIGIVLFGVAVRAGTGVVGRLGEQVLEVAQPLGRESRASTSVRDSLKARSAVRSAASRGWASGSWPSWSDSADAGVSSCSGIAAPARTARSSCNGTRGISRSPSSRPGGRGAVGAPGLAGGCWSRSGAVVGGRRSGSRSAGGEARVLRATWRRCRCHPNRSRPALPAGAPHLGVRSRTSRSPVSW